MKLAVRVFVVLVALGLQSEVSAAEPAADLQSVAGIYEGELEIYNTQLLRKFDYSIVISAVDTQNKELSLRTRCDRCETRSLSFSGCSIAGGHPEITISCPKPGGDVEYLLTGDTIRSKGYNKKGQPFTIVVKKQAQ